MGKNLTVPMIVVAALAVMFTGLLCASVALVVMRGANLTTAVMAVVAGLLTTLSNMAAACMASLMTLIKQETGDTGVSFDVPAGSVGTSSTQVTSTAKVETTAPATSVPAPAPAALGD